MVARISDEKLEHIKRLDDVLMPITQIAKETGICVSTICKYIKPRHSRRPKEDEPLIIALLADGMPVKEVCEKFECSKSYVYRIKNKKNINNGTISVFSLLKEMPKEPTAITYHGKVKGVFYPT